MFSSGTTTVGTGEGMAVVSDTGSVTSARNGSGIQNGVGVADGVGVSVGVGVIDGVGVSVGVGVAVGVAVGRGVRVFVGVAGVAVGGSSTPVGSGDVSTFTLGVSAPQATNPVDITLLAIRRKLRRRGRTRHRTMLDSVLVFFIRLTGPARPVSHAG
jgi:hypothetical protein